MLVLLNHMSVLAGLLYALIYFYYDLDNGFCFALAPLFCLTCIQKLRFTSAQFIMIYIV